MIDVGQLAPDFTLDDQDGNPVKLSELRGRPVVLYFYPRAGTPGCTTQACSIRDNSDEYGRFDARVLGVSPDSVADIKAFAENESLPFTLLADPDHAVTETYGAWGERSMYGNKFMGVIRSTWLIDPDGKVAAVFPKVQPKQHDKKVLKALAALQGAT
jgi:peroxiredoxin Q/BCP